MLRAKCFTNTLSRFYEACPCPLNAGVTTCDTIGLSGQFVSLLCFFLFFFHWCFLCGPAHDVEDSFCCIL